MDKTTFMLDDFEGSPPIIPHALDVSWMCFFQRLFCRRVKVDGFGQRVIRSLIVAGVILFAVGFLADPAWILSYPGMLLSYQSEGNVSSCSECASLPVWLSRWLFDGSLRTAVGIGFLLLVLFIVVFYLLRSRLKSHELLFSAALLVTLLVSPYLYNYDFLLLLVPFACLISQGNLVEKFIVLVCYLVPAFALLVYGRDGNIALLLVPIVLLLVLFARPNNPVIDFTRRAA